MPQLRPHQFQLGAVVFGRNTPYPVSDMKIASYNVNNQDFQVPRSNETRMGIDTEQPGSITFTMGVIDNAPAAYIHHQASPLTGMVEESSKLLTALAKEWKALDYVQTFGAVTKLTYCNGYGSIRRIYGRPRKFEYTRKTPKSLFHKITAEFARADSLTHSDTEYATPPLTATPISFTRLGGDADAWLRIQLTGPMANPHIKIGDLDIQLQVDIAAGHIIEVSSYPWARYIVDLTTSENYRAALIGATHYLDQLTIPPDIPVAMSFTATGTTALTKCVVAWRDAYHTI